MRFVSDDAICDDNDANVDTFFRKMLSFQFRVVKNHDLTITFISFTKKKVLNDLFKEDNGEN